MCGTSQRQYELGQKQGKTLVISRLPSGGTGARRREETNAEKPRGGGERIDTGRPNAGRRAAAERAAGRPAPRRLLIEAEYKYNFRRIPCDTNPHNE